MKYRLDCVWKAVPERLAEEAAEFWLGEGAIRSRDEARQRAEHLVIVARDEDGRIAALSTAYRELMRNFGFSLFLFQMFVGKKHRRPRLAQDILIAAWQELGQRFAAGESRDVLGLVMEVTHSKAMRVHNQTVWRDRGMECVYIGKSPRGNHLRVWYFENSRVPM